MNGRANVRPYNAHVLIGNWYEDRTMEQVWMMMIGIFDTNDLKSILGSIK